MQGTQERQVWSLGQEELLEKRKWLPILVFLPGKFHGQRSLAGYSPWGCKESYMTEQLTLALLFHLQLGGLCVVNPQRKTKKLYRTSLFFFPPPRRNCFIFLESQLYVAIGMKGKKKNLTKQEYDFSFMYIGTFTCLVQNSFNSTNIYWIPTMDQVNYCSSLQQS